MHSCDCYDGPQTKFGSRKFFHRCVSVILLGVGWGALFDVTSSLAALFLGDGGSLSGVGGIFVLEGGGLCREAPALLRVNERAIRILLECCLVFCE